MQTTITTINSAEQLDCDNSGGYLTDCIKRADEAPIGHPIPAGTYSSGGTFIIKNAGCVHPDAVFRFHGAYSDDGVNFIPAPAVFNELQLKQFAQYPKLQNYLIEIGAFNRVFPMTELSAKQIHELTDLPYCESK